MCLHCLEQIPRLLPDRKTPPAYDMSALMSLGRDKSADLGAPTQTFDMATHLMLLILLIGGKTGRAQPGRDAGHDDFGSW